jgi:hypothetical protein
VLLSLEIGWCCFVELVCFVYFPYIVYGNYFYVFTFDFFLRFVLTYFLRVFFINRRIRLHYSEICCSILERSNAQTRYYPEYNHENILKIEDIFAFFSKIFISIVG